MAGSEDIDRAVQGRRFGASLVRDAVLRIDGIRAILPCDAASSFTGLTEPRQQPCPPRRLPSAPTVIQPHWQITIPELVLEKLPATVSSPLHSLGYHSLVIPY